MNTMDYIKEYIGQAESKIPILTDDVYRYVEKHFPNVKRNIINKYIARYAEENPTLVRYAKGVYFKTVITPFGATGINYSELIKRVYLQDGENVIGYETGPSYMNKIGLTTQMPQYTYLATGKNRARILEDTSGLFFVKPIIEITKENYRYLQFLDVLENRMNVQIEAVNYCEILRKVIEKYNLSFERLIGYAKFYKNNKVFMQLAELAQGVNV